MKEFLPFQTARTEPGDCTTEEAQLMLTWTAAINDEAEDDGEEAKEWEDFPKHLKRG